MVSSSVRSYWSYCYYSEVAEESRKPLKSVLKRSSRYEGGSGEEVVSSLDLLAPTSHSSSSRHRRNPSWGSGLTTGSASSSGTEYFSAVSDDEEDFLTPPDIEPLAAGPLLGYEDGELVELFARLDDLMEGSQEQQQLALKMITDSLAEYNNNPSFLWRLCKAQYLNAVLAGQDGARDIKKDLITEAVQSGERALHINQDISEAHKWYAISLGSRGEFQGVKEKILDGFEFKKHIDRAAVLNPEDHITHHLLGRFCYEVSQVTLLSLPGRTFLCLLLGSQIGLVVDKFATVLVLANCKSSSLIVYLFVCLFVSPPFLFISISDCVVKPRFVFVKWVEHLRAKEENERLEVCTMYTGYYDIMTH